MLEVTIREVSHSELRPLFSMSKERVDFKKNSRTRYLGAFCEGKIVGCVGWQMIGSTLRYKTDCVLPEYRRRGIYSQLFSVRDERCSMIDKKKITAFCTPMSLPAYIGRGFRKISTSKAGIAFVEK